MPVTDPLWPRASVWLAREDPDPDLVVVGVPNSRSSLTASNAALAPLEMRQRLDRFSTYHSELDVDLATVPVRDVGNLAVSELDPKSLIPELTQLAAGLPTASLLIFLGGDNAITRPLVAARSEDLGSVGLITFDAHHDVRTLDGGPNNGNPIRGLIEEEGVQGRHIVQIGVHSFANSKPYRDYCNERGITTVTVDEVDDAGMAAVLESALDRLSSSCNQIYVNVDIDVLDSAFVPGCPGARPGGLTVRQLAKGVTMCAAHPAVTAMDFVEVDPAADREHQSIDVMAHLFLSAGAGLATRR